MLTEDQKQIAKSCKQAAEQNTMDFPSIVKQLIDAGFERYAIDFCNATATYYLPNGESITFDATPENTPISDTFNTEAIQTAIKEAQTKVDGYTYTGFRKKIMAAGCAGYIVSFLGRRAVYFGRTGDLHVEMFP